MESSIPVGRMDGALQFAQLEEDGDGLVPGHGDPPAEDGGVDPGFGSGARGLRHDQVHGSGVEADQVPGLAAAVGEHPGALLGTPAVGD